jgi:hypothetical protein
MASHATRSNAAPACQARQRRLRPTGMGSKYSTGNTIPNVEAEQTRLLAFYAQGKALRCGAERTSVRRVCKLPDQDQLRPMNRSAAAIRGR